jgi:hypothetical protein
LSTIFDTGALITAAKFSVRGALIIDHLVATCRIKILPEVKYEAVDAGIRSGYADARELGQRIAESCIILIPRSVPSAPLEAVLRSIGLEGADRGMLQACRPGGQRRRLVSDDHRLYVTAVRLRLAPLFLPDLVMLLVSSGRMSKNLGREILTTIQPRYSKGFIELSLKKLDGVI